MTRILGYDVAVHTSNFTSETNQSVLKIHRCKNDTYILIGRRVAIIVSKIDKAAKGRGGVS